MRRKLNNLSQFLLFYCGQVFKFVDNYWLSQLQSYVTHFKIVSSGPKRARKDPLGAKHIYISFFLYRKVFTDFLQTNKKSENMGKQITVQLSLPLKGMSQQVLDVNKYLFPCDPQKGLICPSWKKGSTHTCLPEAVTGNTSIPSSHSCPLTSTNIPNYSSQNFIIRTI